MRKIGISVGIVCLLLLLLGGVWFLKKPKTKAQLPKLTLQGPLIIKLELGDVFKEPGYQAIDPIDGDITNQVETENNINYETPGTYQITYRVKNSNGLMMEQKRFITLEAKKELTYKEEYNQIENELKGWGCGKVTDHARNSCDGNADTLKKYDAYYQGPDEKKLYLTFDEGSNETYVPEIVDVLNQNDVKATFFFCRRYILDHPDLMKKLVETGHSVGNHTANHISMPTLATPENYQKYVNEIKAVEKAFLEITGTELDKVYREPKGEWSLRSLQIVKDLGYKSYFWSATYLDWKDDVSADTAFTNLKNRYHNGAIYLIHPNNKGNYEALDRFIKEMKTLGYTFDLVKNIP